MATRPVEGEPGWATIYDSYEDISHNADGTLRLIGSEADGQTVDITTGFQFIAVDGVSTKVYTKYINTTMDGTASVTIPHGIDVAGGSVIMALSAHFEAGNGTGVYIGGEYRASSASPSLFWSYTATDIEVTASGTYTNGSNVRIKIEYTA